MLTILLLFILLILTLKFSGILKKQQKSTDSHQSNAYKNSKCSYCQGTAEVINFSDYNPHQIPTKTVADFAGDKICSACGMIYHESHRLEHNTCDY